MSTPAQPIVAKMPDGTTLNFPAGTDMAVVQRVVKTHLSGGQFATGNAPVSGSATIGDQLAAKGSSVADTLSKATTIGAGPGPITRAWNEIKAGLTGAQEGQALPQQPTALGNAAEFAGMIGTQIANLGAGSGDVAAGARGIEEARPAARIASAVGKFKSLEGSIGSNAVQMTNKLSDALSELKEGVDTGLNLPSVANKLVTRLTDLEKGPLTYTEARKFYSNMGDIATSERMAMNDKARRLLFGVQHALGETIADTAEQAGNLKQHLEAMREFAKGMSGQERIEALKSLLANYGKAAAASAGIGAGGAAGYEVWQALFGKNK